VTELVSLFVYGTLRPPQVNTQPEDCRYYPAIADYIHTHQPATLANAALYDLGAYPAATPGDGVIQGDLLQVDAVALPITDRIEGHPVYYRRALVTVQTATDSIEAWVYWAPPGLTTGRRQITNGDWFQRHLSSASTAAQHTPDPTQIDPVLRSLVTRFAAEACSWFSSVRPDGRAHSAPIWHVWYQGRAYVVTPARSVKVLNIAENPSIVLTHPDPLNPIIIEGWATAANHLRAVLVPLFLAKYQWDISNPDAYDTVIEITPTKVLAWGTYGEGRWTGQDVLQVW
jgi:gamma-glutamylcyclotransferase (GGCT)/AIG2-like uncharacterized protein YtfP